MRHQCGVPPINNPWLHVMQTVELPVLPLSPYVAVGSEMRHWGHVEQSDLKQQPLLGIKHSLPDNRVEFGY